MGWMACRNATEVASAGLGVLMCQERYARREACPAAATQRCGKKWEA